MSNIFETLVNNNVFLFANTSKSKDVVKHEKTHPGDSSVDMLRW